jgi:hypothetical protein
MIRAVALVGLGLLAAACTPQPYRPIGYSLPSAGYGPPPGAQFARPRPYQPPLAPPPPVDDAPADMGAPDPNYETPPALLQPLEPIPSDAGMPSQSGPVSTRPPPESGTGKAVPLMGFRPMHGQTPGAL